MIWLLWETGEIIISTISFDRNFDRERKIESDARHRFIDKKFYKKSRVKIWTTLVMNASRIYGN